MNICIYAFGSSPLFANVFLKKCLKEKTNFKVSIILEKGHYIELFRESVDVLYINSAINNIIDDEIDLDILKNYPSNIFKDIESEKKTLKNKDSEIQLRIALSRYKLIKSFLKKNDINHVLYAQHPENFTGLLIGNITKEISIGLSVPIHTRNLDTSFFSNSCQEIIPKSDYISDKDIIKAKNFLKKFKTNHISASISKKENCSTSLPKTKKPSFVKRLINYSKRFRIEKQNREFITFYIAFVNNFTFYRNTIWKIRKYFNKKQFNLNSLDELPKKYIYYPLQYSPESSINIPAPYYIDQMRIIDALRMNMPNDMRLVIKEHPSCIIVRPVFFVKNILKKAGVIVAKYDMNSRELIKNAAVTVSVSGTSSFEAFLLNKPSFVMSQTYFDSFIGGVKGLDNLKETINEKLNETIDDDRIIKALAHIYSVSNNFYGITTSGHEGIMMTKENLEVFFKEFLNHIEKEKENAK